MVSDKEKELFGEGVSVLSRTLDTTKYRIECDTTDGTMNCYHLFPGIDLAYSRFQAASCFQRQRTLSHMIEIAYCRAGRYECEYKYDYFTYLGEGDIAITVMNAQQEKPVFPTGLYDGIAVIVNMEITGPCFSNIVEGVSIDLESLVQKFCPNYHCTVIKSTFELRHVFNEIYESQDLKKTGYLRLKVLELFFLLSELLPQNHFETSAYYSGGHVRKIKAIKEELMNNLDTKESLKSIAKRYGLSLTTMKECFKAVYGKPIHAFQREYKMQMATRILVTTDSSIAEISGKLGYDNPNKFSTAFKSIIGCTPRDYRAKNR